MMENFNPFYLTYRSGCAKRSRVIVDRHTLRQLSTLAAVAILLCSTAKATQAYDFDTLNKGAGSPSITTQSVDGGAVREAGSALRRQSAEFLQEAEAAAAERERAAQRFRQERQAGNGRRHYDCEFYCRGSGFVMYDSTNKYKFRVKADEQIEADRLLREEANKKCGSTDVREGFYKGTSMYSAGERCSEVR